MNLLKKTMNVILFVLIIFSSSHGYSQKKKNANIKKSVNIEISEFNLQKPIVFQEWYAGINVGGTGVTMFIPKFDSNRNIQMDSVYFRNMKGKIVSKDTVYSVTLKNDSPYYVANPSNAKTNPYNLTPYECMIKYTENGQTKYLKIASIEERAGTYYENGPPSIYESSRASIIATVEED